MVTLIFIVFIIINKMKQQITENKENLFFGIKNNTGGFSCNSEYNVVRVRLTQPITIIMHYYICVGWVIKD